MIEKITKLCEEYYPRAVACRHQLHENPELSFEEFKTSDYIAKELERIGIPYEKDIAVTGIVGIIRGKREGKTILLRADMDALPISETSDVPFKSRVPDVCHACGHDGHVAGLLCAAYALNSLKEELCGTVVLVFQPGEENGGGANPMIQSGVFDTMHIDAAIACHLWGARKKGHIGIKAGPIMAGVDTFHITFIGKGGHGASPHLAIDPVVMAADFVMQVQGIVSRRIDPMQPAVITCGAISGGLQHNVIPEKVKISASVRFLGKETGIKIKEEVVRIADGIRSSYNGDYSLDYIWGFPALMNDSEITKITAHACRDIVGKEKVETDYFGGMGAEDFAFFAQMAPAAFFFVGITGENEDEIFHHNGSFHFDDENLKVSSKCLTWSAWKYLHGTQEGKGKQNE